MRVLVNVFMFVLIIRAVVGRGRGELWSEDAHFPVIDECLLPRRWGWMQCHQECFFVAVTLVVGGAACWLYDTIVRGRVGIQLP